MKKVLLLTMMAMMTLCSYGRQGVTTTVVSQDTLYYNSQLQKVADRENAEFYRLFAKESYKGEQRDVFVDYYMNGKKRGQGGYVFLDLTDDHHSVFDGFVTTFYANGMEKWQCNYRNGKRNGYLTLMLRDGSVAVAQYNDGELVHNFLTVTHKDGTTEHAGIDKYAKLLK